MLIMSKEEAYAFSQQNDLFGWRTLSILDPGVRSRYLGGNQTTLWFDDIAFPIEGHIVPPRDFILHTIEKFAQDKTAKNKLIHCTAGISRSTAIAWGILIAQNIPAMDAAKQIVQIRPIASPNRLIVEYICSRYSIGENPFDKLITGYSL